MEIVTDGMLLSISAPIRFHVEGEKRPRKHQLLVEFTDGTAISSSAQMWGGFFCFPCSEEGGWPDRKIAKSRPSPLTAAFDRAYFDPLLDSESRPYRQRAQRGWASTDAATDGPAVAPSPIRPPYELTSGSG